MQPGMTFTIEPVLKYGNEEWRTWEDNWTVEALDYALSAQTEHTILILENGVEILTANQDEEKIFLKK